MFQLKYKIIDRYPIFIEKSALILKDKSSIVGLNIENLEVLWKFEINNLVTEVLKIDDENIIIFNNRRSIFADVHKGIKQLIEGRYHIYYQNYSVFIEIHNPKIIQNSINTYKIPVLSSNIVHFQKAIFQINSNVLTCHTLSTGAEHWRVDLNSFLGNNTHIISNIIDYNEILVFYAKSKEQCSTLCLQQSTGELVKRLDNYGGYYKQYQNCLYFTSAQYQLGILDLDTLQVQVIDFRSILEPKKLEFWYDKFVIDGNDFYFVQNIGAKVARIGIINLILKEIVWLYEFKPQNGQVHDIQLHNNRLYVHTRDNTLHIFEKQENE